MDETRTFIQICTYLYVYCNKLFRTTETYGLFVYLFLFLLQPKNVQLHITRVSIYIIYTSTCFDISMSSSGSSTFVPFQVTQILILKFVERRSARISKLDRKTNKYFKEKMNAQDTTLDEITRKQLIWYGHVERMDPTRLPKIMIYWKPEGREKRGRPQGPGKMGYIQRWVKGNRGWDIYGDGWKGSEDGICTAMSERDLRMGYIKRCVKGIWGWDVYSDGWKGTEDGIYTAMGERDLRMGYIQRWVKEIWGWDIYSDGWKGSKDGIYTAMGERDLRMGYIQRWVKGI
jgi:hypothetical protein